MRTLILVIAVAAGAHAQIASQIRSKISAGDLRSAESILEVHRAKNGNDPEALEGLAWIARGAVLLGDWPKVERYSPELRKRCDEALAKGGDLTADNRLLGALGSAIEVEAQRLEKQSGKAQALRYLEAELSRFSAPVALRSRLYKRINQISLAGKPAPELVIEDHAGDAPLPLARLRGKPVLLFIWAEWCGDCKAQAAALARVKAKYSPQGLEVVGLTRYYDKDPAAEKKKILQVWAESYGSVGTIPLVISTASMERYGGSSTPAFAIIDPKGVVRQYTPTRLTEDEFDALLRPVIAPANTR